MPNTDTTKYVGVVVDPAYFDAGHVVDPGFDHWGDNLPRLETELAATFAKRRDGWAKAFSQPTEAFPEISEIYVRFREVQKLVRAVDAVVADVAKVEGGFDPTFLSIYNQIIEARAALADIK